MIRYAVGFLFNKDFSKVVLINKARPDWQKGRLNGVGGHYEDYDLSLNATMERELKEETGYDFKNWILIGNLRSYDWSVGVYAGQADIIDDDIKQTTDEKPELVKYPLDPTLKTIDNVHWLLPLAKDVLENRLIGFIEIDYIK